MGLSQVQQSPLPHAVTRGCAEYKTELMERKQSCATLEVSKEIIVLQSITIFQMAKMIRLKLVNTLLVKI